VQDSSRILRYAIRIVSENPCDSAFLKDFARLLQILGKKKFRAVLDPAKTFVRASRDARLPGPIGNRRRKPPRCKKRMHLRRSQSESKIANLRGVNALFYASRQLRFFRPEAFVPIS